ncbi:MAG TPA: histidine kinase [Geobacter sp.]|nr:histidine kinase [Geobacter sp.]
MSNYQTNQEQHSCLPLAGRSFDGDLFQGDDAESRQCLAAILATAQVGILVIDAESHVIVEANPKAVEVIGVTRDEILGSVCHRFICVSQIGQCPITDLGQCIDCGERQLITARGDYVTVVKTVAQITIKGRPHLVESFLDISDRKRTEEALRESEERCRDILDNANDLIQSVDVNGSFIYVNRAWKSTLGYSDQEIASMKVFDIITPACRDHCGLLFQQIMKGVVVPRVEVQFLARDGRTVVLEGSINCSFVDGTPSVTRGIFRDMTERNRMERELSQSEERYRQLVEHAPEAIVVHSQGKFLYVNNEAVRLFGAESRDQLLGTPIVNVIHPDYRDMVRGRMRELETPNTVVPTMEMKVMRLDGGVIDVESVGTSISLNGEPAIQVVVRDTTQRKLLEAEREQWQKKLELKVEEKTRHLKEAQAKLIQSEKMVTLGEVVSGASHELNNPLAGILSAIQLLRSSALNQPILPELMDGIDVLESIESAAIRCQSIVEDLIRFSTQTRCNFAQMDLNELLRDSLEVMAEEFVRAQIRVEWRIDPELPAIEGDFVKLLEVFTNILQNSKNALPDQGLVEVSTRHLKKYGETQQVIVSIRDTGCGIPSPNLSKIFDPFFTTKPVGKGPGLGLTVSYGIIKRHGGDIDVRSTVGKGTEVVVTLPVRQPEKQGSAPA